MPPTCLAGLVSLVMDKSENKAAPFPERSGGGSRTVKRRNSTVSPRDVRRYEPERVRAHLRARAREGAIPRMLLEELAVATGAAPRDALAELGGFELVIGGEREVDVAALASRAERDGILVVVSERRTRDDAPSKLVVLPTLDKWEAIAALGVSAQSEDLRTAELVRSLQRVDRLHPFDLVFVRHDAVAGVFMSTLDVEDADRIAEELQTLCPDVLRQTNPDLETYADVLRRERRFLLWWR